MTRPVKQLLDEVRNCGVEVHLVGPDRLRADPVDRVPEGLWRELKAAKPELVAHLSAGWPRECLERQAEHNGQIHARLFPLLGHAVDTPFGCGLLVQSFAVHAAVVMKGKAVFFDPADIRPAPGVAPLEDRTHG